MKNRPIALGLALHFGLSLGGFLGLYGWAAGVQDGPASAPSLGWLELVLRFVVLQPLAHWVLDAIPVQWWTWPGLTRLSLLFLLNSLVVVALIRTLIGALRRPAPGTDARK